MKRTFASSLALFAVLVSTSAHADRIGPGANSVGSVTVIGKGVKELSLETQFVFASNTTAGATTAGVKAPDDKTTQVSLVGAAVFRYFVIDNLDIDLHVGGFFKSASSKSTGEVKTSDAGFLGTVGAAFHASVGGGMFIAPGFGVGGFAGSRENVVDSGVAGTKAVTTRYSISGLALRANLGLVFYSSPHFNLFARPEAIIYIGSAKQKDDGTAPAGTTVDTEAKKFTSIDGGFTCGLSYVF